MGRYDSITNSRTPSTGTFFGGDVDAPFTGNTSGNEGIFGTPVFVDHTNASGVTEKKGANKYKPGSADDGFGVEAVNEIPAFAGYFGQKTKEQKKREAEEAAKRAELDSYLAGQLPAYAQADTDYANDYRDNTADIRKLMDDYLAQFQKTMQGSIASSEQARDSYTDSWLGTDGRQGTKAQMEANADSAMTIEERDDPNNKVAMAYRESYEKDAQAARQQGQQDYGVLSALGAQAAQGQFGMSGPMTAGSMGQIYAQNQNQAGEAYAKAQQRMYDLQQQGRKEGEEQTDLSYKYGQAAIQDLLKGNQGYSSSINASNNTIGSLGGLLKTGQDSTQQYYTDREDDYAGILHTNSTNQLGREGGLKVGQYDYLKEKNQEASGREAADQRSRDQLLAMIVSMMAGGAGGGAAAAGAAQNRPSGAVSGAA